MRRAQDEELSLERWLISDNPDERALADETFAEMGPEATVAFLLNVLERQRPATFQDHDFWYAHALPLPFARTPTLVFVHDWYNATLYITGTLGDFFARVSGRDLRLRRAIFERLCRSSDVRVLPALIEGYFNGDSPEIREKTRAALTRLLPRLGPEDGAVLTRHQWTLLTRLLGFGCDPRYDALVGSEFVRAILHALGNVGHSAARHQVAKLAGMTPENDRERQIQRIAGNYLPLLSDAASHEPQRLGGDGR